MPLKIYGVFPSQPTRAVLFLCRFKNLEYQLIKQSPTDPIEKQEEYKKNINPFGLIPCMEDTDYNPPFRLGEAAAILQYLCLKHKWNDLYPNDISNESSLFRRSNIDSYLSWHHENTRMISKGYVFHLNRLTIPFKDQNQDILKWQQNRAKNALNILENKFKSQENNFVIDNQLSIADFLCFAEVIQLYPQFSVFDMNLENDFPKIYQWCERMKCLEGYDDTHRSFDKYIPFVVKRQKEWIDFVNSN